MWVNDAMVTVYAEFLDIKPEEFRRSTEVSYLGMVWGTRAALKRMVARDRGSIVQVCSAMSYRGIPLQSPYCGAKHACKGFTESIITELLHHKSKVQVSMIQLPGLNTTQFTWGRTKLPKQTMPVPPDLPTRGRGRRDPPRRAPQAPPDLRRDPDGDEHHRRAGGPLAA